MEKPKLDISMTAPTVLSDSDQDQNVSSDVPKRLIVVSNQLPIIATRRANDAGGNVWDFTWDENSIYVHIKDALPVTMEILYVGLLKDEMHPSEYDYVSKTLLNSFNCVAVFVPYTKWKQYYYGFCKQFLWPIFHNKLPYSEIHGGRYNHEFWEAYVSVNKEFSKMVIEAISNDNDYLWIHDYHLMLLPSFLRRHFCRIKIGFFLHIPFPSLEIYKSIPVRNKILKGLLNADVIGFQTFDYARHFLTSCSRMLGLGYQLKRGYICLTYNGRSIGIKIKPTGVHVSQIESLLSQPNTRLMVQELERCFEGKTILLGVDDLDMFKGVNFKALAMEEMLKSHPSLQGRAVLVQILNAARGKSQDVAQIEAEIRLSSERINNELGSPGYEPIVLIDRRITLSEKLAYYAVSEAAIVTPVRDGMNLIPYEYVVSRQSVNGLNPRIPKKSMLVISEFIGCSPSLSGAIKANPWNVAAIAEGMHSAITASDLHKEIVHEKHYEYIRTHDVANWCQSFYQDLERTCIDHLSKRCVTIGLGLESRIIFFDQLFSKLETNILENAYQKAQNRAILLDYDDVTMTTLVNKCPNVNVISMINKLCNDPKNTVFIISGRSKKNLGTWFDSCEKLAIAAEHGYFIRWARDRDWETWGWSNGVEWMKMAEPVMKLYTEATDGSYIEKKETAMVWHYEHTREFGSEQAKELLDHLENVLANEPVAVKRGQDIVEVQPQGVNKGTVATKIFASMAENGRPVDFVLGIGDDNSDEDMFVAIVEGIRRGQITNNKSVFTCTVGQKPSAAEYYIDETQHVLTTLEKLAHLSNSE